MEREKLLFMSNEQIKKTFLHKRVRVVLNDGKMEEFVVNKIRIASFANDECYSVVGIISDLGNSYLFGGIKDIDVVDNIKNEF